MSAPGLTAPPAPAASARGRAAVPSWAARRTFALVERNLMIYRRSITPLLSMLVEPIMYLLSVGIGVMAADQNIYGRIYVSGTGRGVLYSNLLIDRIFADSFENLF